MILDQDIRKAKLEAIREGTKPRVLELCSGCGGMSLGLAAAGFDLVAHVETDPTAAASYALNFAPPSTDHQQAWAVERDMEKIDPSDLVEAIGLKGPVAGHFDVLAAGLPCQAFARIGRSKLRSVKGEEDAYRNDTRAKLYQRFLEYVAVVQPVAIIIENVPDILNFGGHNVPEEICETLDAFGYEARYTLLNAAFYGVPQMRERLFLVAVDKRLGLPPSFPEPVRHAMLPTGYASARSVALKHVPAAGGHYVPPPAARDGLPGFVSTREAISDLPSITEHFSEPLTMRRRKVGDPLPYAPGTRPSAYARLMKAWPGHRRMAETNGHVVRITPRDFPIFGNMDQGRDYPHAHRVALDLFTRRLAELTPAPAADSAEWLKLRGEVVPPYDPAKFPNKWWKLDPSKPSRTLTAHMGKDTYSHIHWDNEQKRTVSVREAARLQSFPDSFEFAGAMNAAFRQIGNAVPPLLAQAVGAALLADLKKEPMIRSEDAAAPPLRDAA